MYVYLEDLKLWTSIYASVNLLRSNSDSPKLAKKIQIEISANVAFFPGSSSDFAVLLYEAVKTKLAGDVQSSI